VLFALNQPATLLGLLVAFLVGSYAQTCVQRLIVGGRRSLPSVKQVALWLDPFSAVAAGLGGMGWAPRQELDRRRPNLPLVLTLVSVAVEAVLAVIGGVGYRLAGGATQGLGLTFASTVDVIHGNQLIASAFLQRFALGFAVESLACGLLALVPIPPLPLGVWLWSALPHGDGARRIAYRLLEEQWGILVILVLLLIPLAGQQPALLALVAAIADPILNAL
jgi:hypothetical protein